MKRLYSFKIMYIYAYINVEGINLFHLMRWQTASIDIAKIFT